jgi:hypothetical protein
MAPTRSRSTHANSVVEDCTYTPGDHTVAMIKATGPGGAAVTDLTDIYDGLKCKTVEVDLILAARPSTRMPQAASR